tara:strand:+ start:201 stop:545 length:345 start_codon:yes stop_codon:yes gene_type:complete
MSKFISVVKFKVKTEDESNFIESMRKFNLPDGLIYRKLIKTSDTSYCSIIEWANEESLINARPQMITFLDTIRDYLIEFNKDLGVTDPASGPVLIDQSGLVVDQGKTITGKLKV